jgi:putative salt-induced outer membrane protein YdiY
MRLISFIAFSTLIGLLTTSYAFADAAADAAAAAAKLGLHHESELGYIVVGGNAKSQSFSGKQLTSYQWDRDLLKFNGHYLSSQAQDSTTKATQGTAENWSVSLREEHSIVKDKFDWFVQAGASGDRFIGVDLGQSYDLGLKYYWVSNDSLKFFSEAGYQYLHEDLSLNNISSTLESHFARLYSQIDYTYKPSIKFGFWVEYLPNLKDNENYRINFSPYMLAILSDTFSLKFGYEGYYRNQPVGTNTEYLDYRHVTALIAKF